jgi:glycine betaine/proline transport system ATP-binding protein
MVFQRFGLFPHKSVLDNVAFGLDIQAADRAARASARERARQWIDTVGLHGYEGAFPRALSGGMQQRVGLARALATDADILLMDEAFSALDPLIRRDMQDQLLDLQSRLHKTIVFITHDLDEALRLGDRIAILKDGRILQIGTGEDILTKPRDAHVAAFVEDVNRAKVLTAGRVKLACAKVRAGTTPARALAQIRAGAFGITYLVDAEGKLIGALTAQGARKAARKKSASLADFAEKVPEASEDMVLEEVLPLTPCKPPSPSPWSTRRDAYAGCCPKRPSSRRWPGGPATSPLLREAAAVGKPDTGLT